jgi:hypothetical protein
MSRQDTIDKLAAAIEAERTRRGGEGRRVFLDLDSYADLTYDLGTREVAGVLRSEANREALRQRLDAEKVEYRPSKYYKASGGGHDVGFVQYRTSPGRRDPANVKVTFRGALGSPAAAHATKKTAAQLDAEIADTLAKYGSTPEPGGYGSDDEGVFYLTENSPTSPPLDEPEFRTRLAAKRAAMRLVRKGQHRSVEVWHRWRGGRYMQGLASEDGWSDV